MKRLTLLRQRAPLLAVLIATAPLWALAPTTASAQTNKSDFNAFKSEQDSLYGAFVDSVAGQYERFVKQQLAEFKKFKEEIDRNWNDALYPSTKDYVEYSSGFMSRFHVDFERGDVSSSVLVDADTAGGDLAQGRRTLLTAIEKAVTSQGLEDPYRLAEQSRAAPGGPLLEGQVVDRSGLLVDASRAEAFAKDVIASSGVTTDTVVAADHRRRIRLTTTFKLVPDHLKRRAQQFLPDATRYAEKYKLDLRLVMAIIHTESYFNPRATSRIPAYGLMQLVPATAGREAFKKVHGTERLLTADDLYDPRTNIELGCAYLNIVRFNYLKDIAGDQEAYPCVIASYNGGIGIVCKTLTGTKNLSKLKQATSGLSSRDLVARLSKDLPYQETRDYLSRVLDRMALYDEWVR